MLIYPRLFISNSILKQITVIVPTTIAAHGITGLRFEVVIYAIKIISATAAEMEHYVAWETL